MDKLSRIQKILSIVIASFIIVGATTAFCWSYFVSPKIDQRIEIRLEPVIKEVIGVKEELIYINCILQVTLPDSLQKKAFYLFKKAKSLGEK